MASYQLVTGPAVEPITLNEAKAYLRVDTTVEDSLITALIVAARRQVEARTLRPLCSQTWKYFLDSSEIQNLIYLNKAPVTNIDSITYIDPNGDSQTIDSSNYSKDLNANPAKIEIKNMPSIIQGLAVMSIQFDCGYGGASDVPQDIKQAMLFIIGHLYENRQDVLTGSQVNEMPMASQFLLEPYRNSVFGW